MTKLDLYAFPTLYLLAKEILARMIQIGKAPECGLDVFGDFPGGGIGEIYE
jgi:hypothetical protein